MKQIEYLKGLLKYDEELFNKIEIKESNIGYSFDVYRVDNNKYYEINIAPKRLNILVKLALAHELGHIVFEELLLINPESLERRIKLLKNNHPIFCSLQKFYYWNLLIRYIKCTIGFGYRINYKPKDIYNYSGFTREENELHSDWFSLSRVFGILQYVE